MKKLTILLSFLTLSLSATAAPKIVSSFSNGSKVSCVAIHRIGYDGRNVTQHNMDVFYRIDEGQKEAIAYFKQPPTIGNYYFDGLCGPEVCELFIRDLRTNTVSNMNAAYSKLNEYSSQIQIMNFQENLNLILKCQLTPQK